MLLSFVYFLPNPWPALTRDVIPFANDYHVEMTATASGRFEISLICKSTNRQLATFVSQRIMLVGEGKGVIVIKVALNNEDQLFYCWINGKPITKGDEEELVISARTDEPDPDKLETDEDGISSALRSRADRLANFRQLPIFGERASQRWQDLAEISQNLREDLERLRAGQYRRVRSVGSQLRNLILAGKGNHVLQDCASFLEMPLLIWTNLPRTRGAFHPHEDKGLVTHFTTLSISYDPKVPCLYQTDLDIWLKQDAFALKKQIGTHENQLKDIADKLGAHADFNERAVSDALAKIHFGM